MKLEASNRHSEGNFFSVNSTEETNENKKQEEHQESRGTLAYPSSLEYHWQRCQTCINLKIKQIARTRLNRNSPEIRDQLLQARRTS